MKKFLKEIREILKDPKKLFFIALYYVVIFIGVYLIAAIFSSMFFQRKGILHPVSMAIIALIYFILIICFYSFIKLKIISLLNKKKLNALEKLGSFSLFNGILFILTLVVVSLVGSFITYSFNDSVAAGAIFLGIFLIFFYPFLLYSQFNFVEKGSVWKSIKTGWQKLFSKRLKYYFKLLMINVIIMILFFIIYYLLGRLYKITLINNMPNVTAPITAYNLIFMILFSAFLIILQSINIIYINKIKD